MRIAVVIPVYNEEAKLEASVAALVRVLSRGSCQFRCEIIVADNGSTDSTLAVARELERRYAMVRRLHLELKGRGRALKVAWGESEADILSYMDVDLSTDLRAFPLVIESLASGRFDLATGTRLHPQSVTKRCRKREFISRCYNRLLRLVFAIHFSDAQCGFKAITREAAQRLLPAVQDNGWFFDTELLVIAEKFGYRVYEQPVKWTEDPDSRVRIVSTAWKDILGMARVYWNLRRGAYGAVAVGRQAAMGGVAG
jgi:glycosyltransferase involved in cell wall biosynthesis